MRHVTFLFTLITALLAAVPTQAESYQENFDASTSLPDGWDFVGGTFYTFDTGSTYYMNSDADYSRSRRNSLCCPMDLAEQYVVTPKVTGQVSIYVRAYRSKRVGSFRVFRVSDDGQTLGEEVTSAARNWTSSNTNVSWQQVSINLGAEGTRLALKLYRAYADDFAAELYQEGEEMRGLSVMSVENLLATDTLKADEANQVSLSFKATLKNVGNVELTPTEENYTVSLLNGDGEVLATMPITDAIAPGESKEIVISQTLTANALITGKAVRFAVREDFTGTVQLCHNSFNITAYLPQMVIYDADPNEGYHVPLTSETAINFGNVCQPLSYTIYVKNVGNAPLVVPAIDVPEGFSVSADVLKVDSGEVAQLTITLNVTEDHYGQHEGSVVLRPEGIDAFSLHVSGITRDPATLYIDFSDQQFPMGWTVGSGWRIDGNYAGTNYYAEQYQYPVSAPSALVSPLLEVAEGEALQFQARAYDTQEWYSAGLIVAYSADLSKWNVVADLTESLTESFQTFQVNNIPSGKWYVRFLAINAGIDEIWGFSVSADAPQMSVFDAEPSEGAASRLTAGKTINFGSTTQAATRTIYIQNTGTGTLDVQTITASGSFQATPASLQLTEGEAAPVTITLAAGEDDFGAKSGTLHIEATGLETIDILLNGITRDPAILFVDFEQEQFTGGWHVGTGWTVTTSYGYEGHVAECREEGDAALVTPLLEVAEGDTLQLDAKCYGSRDWYPPTLRVSYSADCLNWDSIADWSEELTTAFTRYTVSNIPAGRWYVRIEGINTDIDNIEGCRMADTGDIKDVHFHGLVLNEDNAPVAGASVSIGNTVAAYEAQTDEQGGFDITLRGQLAYTLTITHEQHDTICHAIVLQNEDIDSVYVTHSVIPVGMASVATATAGQQAAYDLSGRRVTNNEGIRPGFIVINRRKVLLTK